MKQHWSSEHHFVIMDENGKINGLSPVFNDILALVYNKIKYSDIQPLAEVVATFYRIQDLREAWQLLHSLIHPSGELARLRKRIDISHAIVSHMDGNHADLGCIFLAMDLNNIPLVDVMNEQSIAIFLEHHKVNSQLQDVLNEQAYVRSQLKDIAEQLKRLREERNLELPQANRSKSSSPAVRSLSLPAQPSEPFTPTKNCIGQTILYPNEVEHTAVVPDNTKNTVPRGYSIGPDGFMTRKTQASIRNRPRRSQALVTGVKAQGKLKPTVNEARIFATKFHPNETSSDVKNYIEEQIGAACSVEQIVTRTKRYSSFLITASRRYEQALLDPNTWEEGVQVRRFYGKLRTSDGSSSTLYRFKAYDVFIFIDLNRIA